MITANSVRALKEECGHEAVFLLPETVLITWGRMLK